MNYASTTIAVVGAADGPVCEAKGGQDPAMLLYMPLVRECLELLGEKDIKEVISKIGGVNNASGVFLHPNKEAGQVNSKKGINRRSLSIIPQSSIPPDFLTRLKRGTYI